jgi:hypothetical protein
LISGAEAVSGMPRVLYKFLLAVEYNRLSKPITIAAAAPGEFAMQPLATVLKLTGVAQKLELNSSLQLDNPPSTKRERTANISKGVRRSKRVAKPKVSPQLLSLLQSSSKDYLSQIAQKY